MPMQSADEYSDRPGAGQKEPLVARSVAEQENSNADDYAGQRQSQQAEARETGATNQFDDANPRLLLVILRASIFLHQEFTSAFSLQISPAEYQTLGP